MYKPKLPPLESPGTTLGSRLRWAREAAGLTRSGLARLCPLNPTTVRLIESGSRGGTPQDATVRSLCIVLGVSVAWLCTGRGTAPERADIYEGARVSRKKASEARAARQRMMGERSF